jgi:predicted anti-sigma-YlaC factor YlaD
MTDCSNVEIRELLPEYLNGMPSAARRAAVESHLAACEDCRDEMAMLQLVREAYAPTPTVNVAAIVSALPKRSRRPAMRSWRQSQVFQVAAAVSFIALGGISLAVARSFFDGDPALVAVDTMGTATPGSELMPAISFSGGVSDLEDEDIEALLTALESIEALPVTESSDVLMTGTGRQGT